MSLRESGNVAASNLLREAAETTPKRAAKMSLAWKKEKTVTETEVYSDEEAISLLVEAQLSKQQYNTIRLQAKTKGCNIYPSYNKVRAAKEHCYLDSIIVTEDECEVKRQQLLDHTAILLLLAQQEVVTAAVLAGETSNLVLVSKWRCDGSTGHSQYKQKRSAESFSDADLFLSSLVPLQLQFHEEDSPADARASTSAYSGPVRILWQNPRPSSTRFCRPIRTQSKKETAALAQAEVNYISTQSQNLVPTQDLVEGGRYISVTHKLQLTMTDGKVCNALTSTLSSHKCYVCGATPTEMNKLDVPTQKEVDVTVYEFGLSTLHD